MSEVARVDGALVVATAMAGLASGLQRRMV